MLGDIDETNGAATAARITAAGGEASFLPTDVTRRDAVDALVDRAVSEFGTIDVMCNVAGAMFPGQIAELDEDIIDAGIDLNLKSVLWGCQAATRAMRDSGGGFDNQRLIGSDRRAL